MSFDLSEYSKEFFRYCLLAALRYFEDQEYTKAMKGENLVEISHYISPPMTCPVPQSPYKLFAEFFW